MPLHSEPNSDDVKDAAAKKPESEGGLAKGAEADICSRLVSMFTAPVQVSGKAYAFDSSIENVVLFDGWARAQVSGAVSYFVELDWMSEDAPGSCSCLQFQKRGPCKHLWALALWLDNAKATNQWEGVTMPDSPPATEQPDTWQDRMESLRSISQRVETAFPNPWDVAGSDKKLRYRLMHGVIEHGEFAELSALVCSRLKSGLWGKPRQVQLDNVDASYLNGEEELRLYSLLRAHSTVNGFDAEFEPGEPDLMTVGLEPVVVDELLPRLARSGLLEIASREGEAAPLEWDSGDSWRMERLLEHAEDGTASLWAELVRGDERLDLGEVLFAHRFGLFATKDRLAKFSGKQDYAWLREFAIAGGKIVVPSGQEDNLDEVSATIAAPDEEESKQVQDGTPEPHLHISPASGTRVECVIEFTYGPGATTIPSRVESVVIAKGGVRIARNLEEERKRISQYMAVGGRRSDADSRRGTDGSLAYKQVSEAVRVLLDQGWEITAEGRRLQTAGEFQTSVRSGIDWFDLEGGLTFGDQVASFPELLRAVRGKTNMVELGDGSFGVLPDDWLDQWRLVELAETTKEDTLRFQGNQGWLLDMLLASRDEVEFDAGFEQYRKNLASFDGIEPEHETGKFDGELRDYQRDALGWFTFLRSLGLGGCLADDMGLGKTVQVLALLEARRKLDRRGPSLVVAPKSLIFNWLDEAARFAPDLRVLDYTGQGRRAKRKQAGEIDLLLTTYGTLRRDAATLCEEKFDYVVLDEATAIKNATSQASKAARLLKADHRLTLTGTPIENHVGELWSQLEFLNPGMLGRSSKFQSLVSKGIEPEQREELAKALTPFILRRTKDEVLSELPPKSEQIVICELSKKEEKRYAELRTHFQSMLLGGPGEETEKVEGSKIQVLEALLRLRQAACHPALLDETLAAESSAKLDVLLPRLEELIDEGHKVLVFSQFTSFLSIVRERLDTENITYEYLDGKTRDRKAKVQNFETNPDVHVFLISLKAGGHGLNLTSADYVFLLDPWWNPAVETQAVDRAHRMGQTRPVFAYRLIAKGTVEEHVLRLQDEKRELAESLLSGGQSVLKDLTREDLRALLA